MDFSKLKDGVISFSTFLVSHAIWIAVTFYSVWIGHGDLLEQHIKEFVSDSLLLMESDTAKLLLDTYSLKPLMPAFGVFVVIFILHAHKELLKRMGRYIPPELVWHWMPGLRDISASRWDYVLRQLGPNYTFEMLRAIVEDRYSQAIMEYSHADYSSVYNIFKSLAFINIIIFFSTLNRPGLFSFYLFLFFVAASLVTSLLQIYHSRNGSQWAIENIFRKMLAQKALGEIGTANGKKDLSRQEIREIEEFCAVDSRQPIVSMSWSIPLLGNLRVLKESLFKTKELVKSKQPIDRDVGERNE